MNRAVNELVDMAIIQIYFFSYSVMNTNVYQSSQDFKWLNVDWDMTSIQIGFWVIFNAFIHFSYAK